MKPKTLSEAYQSYLNEVAEEAHTGDVVQKAFYVGAIKAVEIISSRNQNMQTIKNCCLELSTEVAEWIYNNRGRL